MTTADIALVVKEEIEEVQSEDNLAREYLTTRQNQAVTSTSDDDQKIVLNTLESNLVFEGSHNENPSLPGVIEFNSRGLPHHLEEQSTTDTETVQPQAVFIKSEYNGEEEDDETNTSNAKEQDPLALDSTSPASPEAKCFVADKPPFFCAVCRRPFIKQGDLQSHVQIHMKHTCGRCGRITASEDALAEHERSHSEEDAFACGRCGAHFRNSADLRQHSRRHVNEDGTLTCYTCERRFKNSDALTKHEFTHSSEQLFGCVTCQETFSDVRVLVRHVKPYVCPVRRCGSAHGTRELLEKHAMSHAKSQDRVYSCNLCGKDFPKQLALRAHEREHSAKDNHKPHTCSTCGKAYSSNMALVIHRRSHTGEKPYHCTDCGKSFACPSGLRAHEAIHTGKRKFGCDRCDKAFPSRGKLERHTLTHTGERPFICSKCGKAFNQNVVLQKHEALHCKSRRERPLAHACKECDQAFTTRRQLTKHRLEHYGGEGHHCDHCGRFFTRRSYLAQHMKVHPEYQKEQSESEGLEQRKERQRAPQSDDEGEDGRRKAYSCPTCGKTFGRETSLTTHQRLHAAGEASDSSVDGDFSDSVDSSDSSDSSASSDSRTVMTKVEAS